MNGYLVEIIKLKCSMEPIITGGITQLSYCEMKMQMEQAAII